VEYQDLDDLINKTILAGPLNGFRVSFKAGLHSYLTTELMKYENKLAVGKENPEHQLIAGQVLREYVEQVFGVELNKS